MKASRAKGRGSTALEHDRKYREDAVRVLVIDNYDSFTYNLVQYLGELGRRSTWCATTPRPRSRSRGALDRVVVSPGPCTPKEAGVLSVDVMRRLPEAGVPTLGVCLGHQSLAEAFGGTVIRHVPVHGKTTEINHDGRGLFYRPAGAADRRPLPLAGGRRRAARVPECRRRAAAAC